MTKEPLSLEVDEDVGVVVLNVGSGKAAREFQGERDLLCLTMFSCMARLLDGQMSFSELSAEIEGFMELYVQDMGDKETRMDFH